MAKQTTLGEQIIQLRLDGLSYRQIEKKLGCAKSTINYHCEKNNLTDVGWKKERLDEATINKIKVLRKRFPLRKVSAILDLSETTIQKYH